MKKYLFSTFILSLVSLLIAEDHILIITHAYNRPEFIKLHAKTFKAFMQEPFEYVVFNDAPSETMSRLIQEACSEVGATCFRVPPHAPGASPGHRHIDGIRYSLQVKGFDHNGIVLMIDSDMFLIRPLSVKEYMKDYDLIGWYQYREEGNKKIVYIAPSLVFMDMERLPNKHTINFDGNYVEGMACDVGGHMYYYFRDNPSINKKLYEGVSMIWVPKDEKLLSSQNYNPPSIDFIMNLEPMYSMEFHADNNFLHYYAGGSNWVGYGQSYLNEKDKRLYAYIDSVITYYKQQNN